MAAVVWVVFWACGGFAFCVLLVLLFCFNVGGLFVVLVPFFFLDMDGAFFVLLN